MLFFPFRFNGEECCLNEFLSNAEWLHQHGVIEHTAGWKSDYHHLLQKYIFPFGVFWWASIGLCYWSVMNLKKQRTEKQNDQKSISKTTF